jgi:hypothetical protein
MFWVQVLNENECHASVVRERPEQLGEGLQAASRRSDRYHWKGVGFVGRARTNSHVSTYL